MDAAGSAQPTQDVEGLLKMLEDASQEVEMVLKMHTTQPTPSIEEETTHLQQPLESSYATHIDYQCQGCGICRHPQKNYLPIVDLDKIKRKASINFNYEAELCVINALQQAGAHVPWSTVPIGSTSTLPDDESALDEHGLPVYPINHPSTAYFRFEIRSDFDLQTIAMAFR